MLHIIRFHDKPGMQEVREKYMEAHLEWIGQNRSWVLLAGSMCEAPGQPALGGLWIVDAENKSEVLEKIASDPFWANGVRQGVDVFFWGMASDDMKIDAEAMAKLTIQPTRKPLSHG